MSTKKGRLLEKVVAGLHVAPELQVATNVLVPTVRDGKRKREVDILITGSVAGYPIRLAVECKNEIKPIDVPYIDGFMGKLNDIGIPHQHGIFVSTSRFTSGALMRAKELGIKTYLFQGLTADGLSEAVTEAIQSVVYLLLDVREFSLVENVLEGETPLSRQGAPVFEIDNEDIVGNIHDLIWRQWMQGQTESAIGVHELHIALPETWKEKRDNLTTTIQSISAKIQVIGLILTITGEAREHTLLDAGDQSIEKKAIRVAFNKPEDKVAIYNVYSETDLEKFVVEMTKPNLVIGRIRIPRIRIYLPFCYVYYPLSQSTVEKLVEIAELTPPGRAYSDQRLDPAQIEGTDFEALWEPIWEKYPTEKMLGIK